MSQRKERRQLNRREDRQERSEERRKKGRENREKLKSPRESLQHYRTHLGERPSGLPRMPQTEREMKLHLSGKHSHLFRDPINRKERRQWDEFWKLKGRGFTKSGKKRHSRFA